MRIIYDISRLGECYREPLSRSGLSRVIENVAYGLVASPDCQVSFSAAQSFAALSGALEYLKHQPRLSGVPFLSPANWEVKQRLGRSLGDVNAEIDGATFSGLLKTRKLSWSFIKGLKLQQRIERRWLAQVRGAAEAEPPFDPRWTLADIFHSPFHPLPKRVRGVQRFLTLYDLIPILYPNFCVPSQVQFANAVLQSIEPEDWVLSISQATKCDLCDRTSIDPDRVSVTHLAAAPELFYHSTNSQDLATARKTYGIPEAPYLLSLNTLEPRKNIAHVVRCFAKLVREQDIKDLNLVLVGAKGWLYEDILETISAYESLKKRIIITGYVADEHLAALYSDALAFVFLSHYEGFGLPVLEAMQCGTPVVASNVSSIPEVVGDAGVLCHPNDTEACCQALLDIYRSSALRGSMAKKSLARAAEFSWAKCVQQTIFAYQRALT